MRRRWLQGPQSIADDSHLLHNADRRARSAYLLVRDKAGLHIELRFITSILSRHLPPRARREITNRAPSHLSRSLRPRTVVPDQRRSDGRQRNPQRIQRGGPGKKPSWTYSSVAVRVRGWAGSVADALGVSLASIASALDQGRRAGAKACGLRCEARDL